MSDIRPMGPEEGDVEAWGWYCDTCGTWAVHADRLTVELRRDHHDCDNEGTPW